jgi:hypothetical protein
VVLASSVLSDPCTPQSPSVDHELCRSSQLIAKNTLLIFFRDLPSRHWIGKSIVDSVKEEYGTRTSSYLFAEKFWTLLIDIDFIHRDIACLMLLPELPSEESRRLFNVLDSCWKKLHCIFEDSSLELTAMNPAYVRSSFFSSERLVTISIIHVFVSPSLRTRLARLDNLMRLARKNASELGHCPPSH